MAKNKTEQLKELFELIDGVFETRTIEKKEDDIDIICAAAIEKFGKAAQIMKAIEELSELQRALARYIAWSETDGKTSEISDKLIENIHEELADTCIMCIQMEQIFGHDKRITSAKIEHLRELVEMER